jgi:hypothetical protein
MTFQCLRVLLGMEPDLERRRLVLDPALPSWLTRIDVEDLEVHDATVSFGVRRERKAVRVTGGGERIETKHTTATT